MDIPVAIVFEGFDSSEFIEKRIHSEVEKLEKFNQRLTSCRVVIEAPHRRHKKGNLYTVRIHITLPGGAEIAVNRNPSGKHEHEDPYVAIRDSFAAAQRQMKDMSRKMQLQIKTHESPSHGVISKLFRDEDYGFIMSSEGYDVYFHRNSVDNNGFDQLEVGGEVRFNESLGEKGPQTTFVTEIGKHHIMTP